MSVCHFWAALEGIRGQAAVGADWQRWLGAEFEPVRDVFLQLRPDPASTLPCPRGCGCRHEVICGTDRITGVCRCDSWNCDDLVLTREEVAVWELSWTRLRRALAACFELKATQAAVGVAGIVQVGCWSCDAVPVLLIVHTEAGEFRSALAELVARLRRPFVLFAPTHVHLDAAAHELLSNVQGAALALDAITSFEQGHLCATSRPGELFAKFTPAAGEGTDESVARRAFALVQKLKLRERQKPPTVLDVFRLYCIEQWGCEPNRSPFRLLQGHRDWPARAAQAAPGHQSDSPAPALPALRRD